MYIDYDYYANCYGGAVDAESFPALAARSCHVIDIMTKNKIGLIGFDKLEEFQKEQVKLACAAQLEYLHENGGLGFAAGGAKASSVKIGSFSVSERGNKSIVSSVAEGHLAMSGLLYAGVNVCV